ncbi:MAG: PaaI family thioesterase [Bacteroidota bacterium]
METVSNTGCFACGVGNPIGLGLKFLRRDGSVHAAFTPLPWHQGFDGLVHGGIIATLLDEAMAHALLAHGIKGVTGKLMLRFRAPLRVGTPVIVTAGISADRGRIVETRAEIRAAAASIATAEALFAVQHREG